MGSGKPLPILDFFGDKVAFEAAGAQFYRKSGAFNLGFYLNQIGFPCPPGAVLGVADLIPGHGMFSAQITSPRHRILPYSMPLLAAILIKWLREAETLPYINMGKT
jgi:hypothetical protein